MATTPAKKTSAPRKRSAAVAARAEVRGEKNKATGDIVVKFRGQDFTITRDHLGSHKLSLRYEHANKFRTADAVSDLLFEILGRVDSARFIDLMTEDDNIWATSSEFLEAMNKAAKVPNS